MNEREKGGFCDNQFPMYSLVYPVPSYIKLVLSCMTSGRRSYYVFCYSSNHLARYMVLLLRVQWYHTAI